MQSPLKTWAVKRQSTPQRVGPTLQQQQQQQQQQQKVATGAGLVWPQPHKRHLGRPSRVDLWQNALYKVIATGDLAGGLTSQPPPWWREGFPLHISEEET
eukprot:5932362-Amphidinium_carterae.1